MVYLKKAVIIVSCVVLLLLLTGILMSSASPQPHDFMMKSSINNPPIKSTDSDEIKQKKLKKTELINQSNELIDKFNKEVANKTATKEDGMLIKKQTSEIAKQIDALDLDPMEGVDKGQSYEQQVIGYLNDQVISINGCYDENGKLKTSDYFKNVFEYATKRKAYLESKKKDFESGKITADEAISSLTNTSLTDFPIVSTSS
jgi:hypothetical protein